MLSRFLDKTIFFSFDESGFKRHQKEYFDSNDIQFSPENRFLVTGGTSGLGKALAEMISEVGSEVVITGRHRERAQSVLSKLKKASFLEFDLADWGTFRDVLSEVRRPFDGVVLNAGGMPQEFRSNSFGVESQAASQLFGHFYFLKLLDDMKLLKFGARVVWMSSGGMYLKSFDSSQFFDGSDYDKVNVYANVKRAQVEVLPLINEAFANLHIYAMHPGWVDTPGLQEALTDFTQLLGGRLRNPREGVDTAFWLLGKREAAPDGQLYFDRKVVSKNLSFLSKSHKGDGEAVLELLKKYQPF